MSKTRLMRRRAKAPIRRPAIAHEHAREVATQHRGGLLKAAARLNAIDRRPRRGVRPQPGEQARDLPARLIRTHLRTAAHLRAQVLIRGARLPRRPMDRLDEAATRDVHAIELLEQRRDLAERQAQLFIEHDNQRDELGPEVDGRRAERIRGLPRVPALHAAPAVVTPADVHRELAHDDPADGNFFLILRRGPGLAHRPLTRRTVAGQWRVIAFINAPRPPAVRLRAIASARLATGASRTRFQRLGERCRLPEAGAPRRLKVALQPINPSLQPHPLALELFVLLPQRLALALRALRALAPTAIVAMIRKRFRARHAAVMPEFLARYKSNPLNSYETDWSRPACMRT